MATNIGDIVIKDITGAIKSFRESLDEMNKTYKADMDGRTKEDRSLKRDINEMTKYLEDMSALVPNIEGTAKTVSRVVGMQKGTIKTFEDKFAEMINKNEDIRSAIKHGNVDILKNMLVAKINEMSNNIAFSNEQEKEMFRLMKDDLVDNFATVFDVDKILAKGTSIFFPLTQKFYKGAEMMRSTVVKDFPFMMKFMSRDMVEHYKQGIGEVGSMIKNELAPILAPIDALVGPFSAVFKGGFMLLKTFFSQSTEHDKATAEYSQKTYEILRDQYEDEKKAGTLKDPKKKGIMKYLLPITALFIGFFEGVFASLGRFVKPFKALGNIKFIKDLGFVKKFVSFFDKLKLLMKASPFSKLLGVVGKFMGKLVLPLIMAWKAVQGLMGEGSIRDRILAASAGILSVFLELPEWISNKVLGLFTDFKVDFGTESIMSAVNKVTEVIYTAITEPFLDWLLIDIPKMFNDLKGSLSTAFGKTMDFGGYIKNQIIDMLITSLGGIPVIGPMIKELSSKKVPSLGFDSVTKNMQTVGSTNSVDVARAHATSQQIQGSRAAVAALGDTNKHLTENNNMNKQIFQNQQNIQVVSDRGDFPTDPDSYAMLLLNKG